MAQMQQRIKIEEHDSYLEIWVDSSDPILDQIKAVRGIARLSHVSGPHYTIGFDPRFIAKDVIKEIKSLVLGWPEVYQRSLIGRILCLGCPRSLRRGGLSVRIHRPNGDTNTYALKRIGSLPIMVGDEERWVLPMEVSINWHDVLEFVVESE